MGQRCEAREASKLRRTAATASRSAVSKGVNSHTAGEKANVKAAENCPTKADEAAAGFRWSRGQRTCRSGCALAKCGSGRRAQKTRQGGSRFSGGGQRAGRKTVTQMVGFEVLTGDDGHWRRGVW